jgi:hypothetical protein
MSEHWTETPNVRTLDRDAECPNTRPAADARLTCQHPRAARRARGDTPRVARRAREGCDRVRRMYAASSMTSSRHRRGHRGDGARRRGRALAGPLAALLLAMVLATSSRLARASGSGPSPPPLLRCRRTVIPPPRVTAVGAGISTRVNATFVKCWRRRSIARRRRRTQSAVVARD